MNEPYLQQASDDDLFGEIRRRNLSPLVILLELNLPLPLPQRPRRPVNLRYSALLSLGLITVLLVGIVGYIAIQNKPIPDLLSGLAGSGIGAIAGILSGGPGIGGEQAGGDVESD
jgi:hypothetical protein